MPDRKEPAERQAATRDEGPARFVAGAARRISPVDWLMLALALFSIGLLSYETWWDVSAETTRLIITLDVAICAIFAVEFVWRWRQAGWVREFVLRNWYEILGMIPVSHPAIRGFRLFRVIRIIILLSRFGMAADRAFGEEFTYRLVSRFKRGLVDAISGTVTVAVLDEVAKVLGKGQYTRNIGLALEKNQDSLRNMIIEKLAQDPRTRTLSHLPFYDDIVQTTVDTSLRMVFAVLEDPRTDELVADILNENLQQIRESVRQNEAARQARAAG
jgi:voltage-gated potassium channel